MDVSKLTAAELAQLGTLLAKAQSADTSAGPEKKSKRKASAQIKYLTEDEIEVFFRTIGKVATSAPAGSQRQKLAIRDMALFRLAYHRGLRASELGALELSSWHRQRDRLVFERLKGSNGGEYHLTAKETRALQAWVRIRGDHAGPLFPSRQGRGISQQMLDVLMKRYGAAAGLPADRCHMHSLKHSCATHLLNKGLPLEDVQDHLGHRSITSTQVYAKYTNRRRQERDRRLRDW